MKILFDDRFDGIFRGTGLSELLYAFWVGWGDFIVKRPIEYNLGIRVQGRSTGPNLC